MREVRQMMLRNRSYNISPTSEPNSQILLEEESVLNSHFESDLGVNNIEGVLCIAKWHFR